MLRQLLSPFTILPFALFVSAGPAVQPRSTPASITTPAPSASPSEAPSNPVYTPPGYKNIYTGGDCLPTNVQFESFEVLTTGLENATDACAALCAGNFPALFQRCLMYLLATSDCTGFAIAFFTIIQTEWPCNM